ncbi:polyisoprenoid-binding protein [Sphingobacterium alkalisoli]|uniref:Polyisoprenoid-binding protein n=1 Tax=Sphingobacterium alkalisoli TaxID=1874115 RepID=A0A4U0GXJ5_9SPHI|nr:YceI family protein [Sphingobacterium alkalisoli]TJY63911.1 polyisoprenoid-binding protein [Sphingobacterium alkalisoli]GGH24105.1 polyisoprenoid-binding protein [Sphingobacterium alkalisoli]
MATWNLDKAHSEIEFKVRHMMISSVKGQFNDFDITVNSPTEDIVNAVIEVSIQTDSINTKNEQRDKHLKSPDFFDIENFKKIAFQSTEIKKVSDAEFTLVGNLTIKEVTKPTTFQVEFGGVAKDPWGNKKIGYTVTGKINREEFGLTWNAALETGGVMVSEDVKFQADIQFILSEN